jgi:quinol monooxygenase YgiN
MSKLVNLVRVRVHPEARDRLMPAMLENARQSVLEDTCYQFDVIQSHEDENEFIFYEVYENEEALATHRETPHFLTYFALIQELDDKVERTPLLYDIIS